MIAMPRGSTRALISALLLLSGCRSPDPTDSTPKAADAVAEVVFACAAPHSAIAAIQGTGASSPLLGHSVDVEGVVVGAFARGLGGVFLAAPAAAQDADASSAEGLWIELGKKAEKLTSGRYLRVRGTVVELGQAPATLTALNAIAQWKDCGARDLPAAIALATPPDDWERFEGMRIALPGPLTVIGNDQLQRFGQLTLGFSGRQVQPTEAHAPGPTARDLAAANRRARLILDDADAAEFPTGENIYLPEQPSRSAPWRAGSRVSGVSGVLDQRYGQYRIQATERLAVVEQAPRPNNPPAVAGRLRISSFNVLNFFNGDGRGAGFPTARGATHAVEFKRQRAKVVAALAKIQPDIAALMELENDGYGRRSAIADLVASLNQALGPTGDYRYVSPSAKRLGIDQIAVGLIYRAKRVRLVGAAAGSDAPSFDPFHRPPLAQTFRRHDGGAPFTVVANHFKSKGGCHEADPANIDHHDGQACWNALRVAHARALADWLAGDPTGSGSSAVLILGDLNAHAQEDPLRLLRERGYSDAFAQHPEMLWSYVYDGLSGRLDHALLSPALLPRLAGAAEWHINADELELFDYNDERKPVGWQAALGAPDSFRSSDHDPLIIGLDP